MIRPRSLLRPPAAFTRALFPALLLALAVTTPPTGAAAPSPLPVADSAAVAPHPADPDSTAPASVVVLPGVPSRDYAAELRAGFSPENRVYARIKALMRVARPLAAVLICALLLFSGAAAAMRDAAHALTRRTYLRVLVFLVLFTLVAGLLSLPLDWYDGFALEHQFGLATQRFGAWLGDQAKTTLVSIVTFGVIPILALVYAAFRRWPRGWWIALALGSVPLLLAGTLLQPLLFDPLFNQFKPLRDRHLAAEILALADRAGIPARHVYEVDRSAQTRKLNAYVSGFGASQRIVLWDTTLDAMRDDEILFVTGHEIGHYTLGHVWKGVLFSAAFGVVLLFAAQQVCHAALRRFGARWGVRAMDDVASLPLLVGTVSLLAFLSQPMVNAYSREIETQTDVYGLEITRDNDAAARAFLALARYNRSDPDPPPVLKWMLYSHPPAIERVRLALSYRPWADGRPGRYVE